MLSQRQLEMRRTGLGASEIAAAVGESPFQTPFDLWHLKVLGASQEETQAMRLGSVIEDGICKLYALETGLKLRKSRTRRHQTEGWLLATPDREAYEDGHLRRLVEAKSVGPRTAHHWGDGPEDIPAYYRCQVAVQMAVTGAEEVDVAALFLQPRDFRIYRIKRRRDIEDALLEGGRRFWFDHVIAGVPPPIDGTEAAREYLATKYPRHKSDLLASTHATELLARQYAAAREAVTAAEKRMLEAGNLLKEAIGEHEGIIGDWGKATWKTEARGDVAYKAMAEALIRRLGLDQAHAEELADTFRGRPSRPLRVKVKDPS